MRNEHQYFMCVIFIADNLVTVNTNVCTTAMRDGLEDLLHQDIIDEAVAAAEAIHYHEIFGSR